MSHTKKFTICIVLLLIFSGFTSILKSDDKKNYQHFDLSSNARVHLNSWQYFVDLTGNSNITEIADSLWKNLDNEALKYLSSIKSGICFYQTQIVLNGKIHDFDFLTINFRSFASAFELYWDSVFIAQNGQVAHAKAGEKTGNILFSQKIKREWTEPGKHKITVRASNHNFDAIASLNLTSVTYLSDIKKFYNQDLYISLLELGVFIVAGLFSFAFFLGGGRNRSFLLLFFLCLTYIIYATLILFTRLSPINIVSYYRYFYIFFFYGTLLSTIFLNIFLIYNFDIPKKYLHIPIITISTILLCKLFGTVFVTITYAYSIFLLSTAIKRRMTGSIITLIGLIIYSISTLLFIQNKIFYLGVAGEVVFLFCVALSISRQIKVQNQLHEASQLRFARLETELVKKNIQPHFLMNTLFSIMSWLDENPQKAKKLIQSLADEFRVINKISSKKEIPLFEELNLCETHLKLMGYRKDANYQLIKKNLSGDEMIPPMIFHTLIENGLTHAYQTGEDGCFRLSCEKVNGYIRYKLQNDGSLLKNISSQSETEIKEGMGMKYVRARLQEKYPDKWQISYGLTNGRWEVDIIITKS